MMLLMLRFRICLPLLLALCGTSFLPGASEVAVFAAEPIDAKLAADESLEAYLSPYRAEVAAFATQVVGFAAEPLSRRRPECGLSNLVADAMRIVGAREFESPVDLAVTNFGGLRRDLPEGPLTMGLVTELSPFENYLTYLEVRAECVREIARRASKGFALSGIEVSLDAEERLLEVWVGGVPLEQGRSYRIVTIDYLVSTFKDLFRDEWILERRVSSRLVQRDAIAQRLTELQAAGEKVFDAGDGRVKVGSGLGSRGER